MATASSQKKKTSISTKTNIRTGLFVCGDTSHEGCHGSWCSSAPETNDDLLLGKNTVVQPGREPPGTWCRHRAIIARDCRGRASFDNVYFCMSTIITRLPSPVCQTRKTRTPTAPPRFERRSTRQPYRAGCRACGSLEKRATKWHQSPSELNVLNAPYITPFDVITTRNASSQLPIPA